MRKSLLSWRPQPKGSRKPEKRRFKSYGCFASAVCTGGSNPSMDCFIKRESNKSFRIQTKKNRVVYLEFKLYCYSNKWHFNFLHIVGINFWMLYVILILAGKEAFVFIFLCSLWQLLQRIMYNQANDSSIKIWIIKCRQNGHSNISPIAHEL